MKKDADRRWMRRLVRQFGPEICWLGMIGMVLLANTKSAGIAALLASACGWCLGFLTARICKPNTSEQVGR